MGRRGHGEGTIRQRGSDGRWEARFTLDGGSRKSVYGKTRAEVARQLAELLRDQHRGLPVAHDERQTVGHYLADWLQTIKPTMKQSSWVRYESDVRLHLMPTLGKVKLARLTAQQLQRTYADLQATGMSRSSVAHVHAVMHKALEAAAKLDAIPRNVADLVDAPRAEEREMHPLTHEQAHTLLEAADGDRLEALYVLAVHTGARLGELLALTWQDVHLDQGWLQVRHTLRESNGGKWQLTEPKTKRSRRRIDLNRQCVQALRAHHVRQKAERLAAPTWQDHDFVFTRKDGHPLRGVHVYQRDFKKLLARAGLPDIRFHDLRHTAATLLLQELPIKTVSELLGHSSIAITADRYGHVTASMQKSAADAMERLFSRA